jgi:hypothetical protein
LCLLAILRRFGIARNAVSERIKNDLYATGNSQLVKDPEKIILNRMFCQFEALRDFAVGEAIRQTADDVSFTSRKQRTVVGLEQSERGL